MKIVYIPSGNKKIAKDYEKGINSMAQGASIVAATLATASILTTQPLTLLTVQIVFPLFGCTILGMTQAGFGLTRILTADRFEKIPKLEINEAYINQLNNN